MTCENIDTTSPNNSTPETIQVGYLSLGDVNGVTYYHQFILYTDSMGNQFATRGGPSNSDVSFSAFENTLSEGDATIISEVGNYNSSFTDHPDWVDPNNPSNSVTLP